MGLPAPSRSSNSPASRALWISSSIQVSQLFPAGFGSVMAPPPEPTRDSLPYSTAWRSWATTVVLRREAALGGGGGDIDDEPVLLGAHGRQGRLHHVEGPGEIDGENVVPVRRGDFVESPVEHVDPRVVDENIDALQAFEQTLGSRIDLWAVSDVQCLDDRRSAEGLDLRGNLIERVAPPPDEGDRRALPRKHQRARLANPRARARHPHDLARECAHLAPPTSEKHRRDRGKIPSARRRSGR